jgi:prolyl-tRNA synthetase
MKDAYSFDINQEEQNKSYYKHDGAYRNIFDRCKIKYFVVGAFSGAMGGSGSEEFMVESDAGEDTVAHCESCGYSANVEVATSKVEAKKRTEKSEEIKEIHTPNVKSIDELCEFLKIDESQCAKSRVYIHDGKPVLILMHGNDEVNESKLENYLGGTVRPGHPEELLEITGADAGSIGPIGFKQGIIVDNRLKDANNMFSGANKNDYHIGGIDFKRDVEKLEYTDLRIVETGEGCPNISAGQAGCDSKLNVFTAIELGHIFKLGTKYAEALGANYLDVNGKEHPIVMGSYGIGVERIMACYLEQNHDEYGIIWDKTLAPFDIQLMGLNMKKELVVKASNKIYDELTDSGFEVLFDDRSNVQAGFKFNDADLLGMPVQVIVGDKKLKENKVEIKIRRTGERFDVELSELAQKIKGLI